MPDTVSRTPAIHPMDPRCCESLSPMFTAFLCWLLGLPPMTEPAITGVAVTGDSVLAATDADPYFNAHLGSLADFERNIRGWGEACGADAATIEDLLTRLRSAART